MPRKSRCLSLGFALILAGCVETPPPAPSPPPVPQPTITGFKFLELGMTLDQVFDLPEIQATANLICERDGRGIYCVVGKLSIAEVPAEVRALFVAPATIEPYQPVAIPPIHKPSMQEIRMGNAHSEESKEAASIRARKAATKENDARQQRFRHQFQLARIEVITDADNKFTVMQALEDNYGESTADEFGFHSWASPTVEVLADSHLGRFRVTFLSRALSQALQTHYDESRRDRANDL